MVARLTAISLAFGLLSACAGQDVVEGPVALGNFKLGHNIVVADNPQKVPISRNADPQDWDDSLTAALDERLGRYDGDKFYNLGVSVDAYALAPPGIPLVLSPKSALVVTATLWDDALGKKINEGEQFTVFEGIDGDTMIGSGLTRTAEEQMEKLSFNAAKRIERWLSENPEWFGLPPKPKNTAVSSK
ncbi:hypothetical protein EOK75_15120 (plasmid) [Pseudorhodobacter turbinis]|uniref:DUF3313 domain-containing protein n=1 Tax=Pseudorhodobacter turbinis TaxID=2500533 RepID=A0A4P8EL60_9RHOB|nr:hypothetical protein EOK75_15120 [Pseudorhodobacter turbinis]